MAASEVQVKRLVVELSDANTFNTHFEGHWTGKDINVVLRTLNRAYSKHNLALKRAKQTE